MILAGGSGRHVNVSSAAMAEPSLSPVGEWDALNADRFYAREHLSQMQWTDIRLDEMRHASANPSTPLQSLVACCS